MTYGLLYAAVALACALGAVGLRGPGWLLLWPAVSLAMVAAGYLGLGGCVCGKRPDGRLSWWSVLLLPYLLAGWLAWGLARLRGHVAYEQLAPDIWIGRRLGRDEQPPQIAAVVDLTCEFAEPAHLRTRYAYRCFPLLDGTAPAPEVLVDLVEQVRRLPRPLYIHCAAGRGRAAMLGSLLLIAEHYCADAEQAIARVQLCRPRTFLTSSQRRAIEQAARLMADRRDSGHTPAAPERASDL